MIAGSMRITGIAFAALIVALVAAPGATAFARSGSCGYYTNSNGQEVSRPCRDPGADPNHRPTALCRDGTYSFSRHPYASGTCSYHGGVARHL